MPESASMSIAGRVIVDIVVVTGNAKGVTENVVDSDALTRSEIKKPLQGLRYAKPEPRIWGKSPKGVCLRDW